MLLEEEALAEEIERKSKLVARKQLNRVKKKGKIFCKNIKIYSVSLQTVCDYFRTKMEAVYD